MASSSVRREFSYSSHRSDAAVRLVVVRHSTPLLSSHGMRLAWPKLVPPQSVQSPRLRRHARPAPSQSLLRWDSPLAHEPPSRRSQARLAAITAQISSGNSRRRRLMVKEFASAIFYLELELLGREDVTNCN
ncbi:hypothetical protein AAHA92_17290 [Salvia divinorum]|uniref:Uncharacterized protein n=1 Tax=Salvia divinorum TaxID=28513 RepID=A0ABD1GYB8_SALDI